MNTKRKKIMRFMIELIGYLLPVIALVMIIIVTVGCVR